MGQPGFWDKQEQAQATVGELKALGAVVKPLGELMTASDDLAVMLEMADEDPQMAAEVPAELERLETKLDELELTALLDGPHDGNNALLSIHARDGGIDANDWAEMLLRMYIQWAQKNGYESEILDRQDNEEAGISNATILVRGPMAYGYLKGETGMHRLVRISPFNAEGKRQTSFAAVDVSPEINETTEIEIRDEDVREDVFRASGAGGQHVNKTSSAIRLTHLPTNIVVQCQNDRSQHRNRAEAMAMLKSRLYELELRNRQAEQQKLEDAKTDIGWGHQIRSYVLDQSRIKDLRTNVEVGNTQAVLDGNLDPFIAASLKQGV
jgi:peptide chain release factor 2